MIPLVKPPSFQYKSIPPYTVTHEINSAEWRTWQFNELDNAVMIFYKTKFATDERRVLFDARGTTILGIDMSDDRSPAMVGTDEATKVVLQKIGKINLDTQAEVLVVVEDLAAGDGCID
jgi:hypothetical protein